MAGISRFIARTAAKGLMQSLHDIWIDDMTPIERRRAFEDMFPSAMGFWAEHCTWTGKRLQRPTGRRFRPSTKSRTRSPMSRRRRTSRIARNPRPHDAPRIQPSRAGKAG